MVNNYLKPINWFSSLKRQHSCIKLILSMNYVDFLKINDRLCKFKLRGGKEVFGIIWENTYGDELIHYFSTAAERMRYKVAEKSNDDLTCQQLKIPVRLEDIVIAEPLSQ